FHSEAKAVYRASLQRDFLDSDHHSLADANHVPGTSAGCADSVITHFVVVADRFELDQRIHERTIDRNEDTRANDRGNRSLENFSEMATHQNRAMEIDDFAFHVHRLSLRRARHERALAKSLHCFFV